MTYQEEISEIHDEMVKSGKTYSNLVKLVDDEDLTLAPPQFVQVIQKTNNFLAKVSDELKKEGLDHKIVNIGIVNVRGSVRKHISMKSRLVAYEGVGSFVILEGEGWFVRIGNAEFRKNKIHNSMFLEHIEIDDKSKGLGTLIMNIILDVCDEMNHTLTCVPTDIRGKRSHLGKIRNWYSLLEFKPIKHNKIFYQYNPK